MAAAVERSRVRAEWGRFSNCERQALDLPRCALRSSGSSARSVTAVAWRSFGYAPLHASGEPRLRYSYNFGRGLRAASNRGGFAPGPCGSALGQTGENSIFRKAAHLDGFTERQVYSRSNGPKFPKIWNGWSLDRVSHGLGHKEPRRPRRRRGLTPSTADPAEPCRQTGRFFPALAISQ